MAWLSSEQGSFSLTEIRFWEIHELFLDINFEVQYIPWLNCFCPCLARRWYLMYTNLPSLLAHLQVWLAFAPSLERRTSPPPPPHKKTLPALMRSFA